MTLPGIIRDAQCSDRWTGPADASQTPQVFLIHGIDDDGRIFHRMRPAIEKAGYRAQIIEFKPNDGREGIDELARKIRASIYDDPPRGPFGIVGFSMGGLVARAMLCADDPPPSRPQVFISISSPHRGTWMAWTRLNAAGRQMRCGSPFLDSLEASLPRLDGIFLGTIRTPFDLVILPASSSILPNAQNESIPVLLHPLMPLDSRVITRTIGMLHAGFSAGSHATHVVPEN